jgi:hypothetical protein
MKKHIVFFGLLAILLIAVLLAGCGGGGDTQTTSPTGTTTSPTGTTTSPTGTTTSPTGTTTPPPVTTTTNATDTLRQTLGKSANYPIVYYDTTTSVSGLSTITTVKYWIKNQKYRIESVNDHIILLMDFSAQTMYFYFTQQNVASSGNFDATDAPEAPTSLMKYNPQVVGTDNIGGKECTVIEYILEQANVREWIWNDNGFPVMMVSKVSGVTTTVEWRNYDFSDIDDSIFKLPEDVYMM